MGFSRHRHPQKLRLHPHPLPSWNTASGWCLRERKDKQTATHRHSAMLSMSHTLRAHTFSHVHTHTDGRQRVSVEMQTLGCDSHWVPKAMFLCQSRLDLDRRWYCFPPEIDIVKVSGLTIRINRSWFFGFKIPTNLSLIAWGTWFQRLISMGEHCLLPSFILLLLFSWLSKQPNLKWIAGKLQLVMCYQLKLHPHIFNWAMCIHVIKKLEAPKCPSLAKWVHKDVPYQYIVIQCFIWYLTEVMHMVHMISHDIAYLLLRLNSKES